jgi:hypothetical protein
MGGGAFCEAHPARTSAAKTAGNTVLIERDGNTNTSRQSKFDDETMDENGEGRI